MDETGKNINDFLKCIIDDMLNNERNYDSVEDFYKASTAYQLGRIADSLDALCSIMRSGLYVYPN